MDCRICGNELDEIEEKHNPKDLCADCFWKKKRGKIK